MYIISSVGVFDSHDRNSNSLHITPVLPHPSREFLIDVQLLKIWQIHFKTTRYDEEEMLPENRLEDAIVDPDGLRALGQTSREVNKGAI